MTQSPRSSRSHDEANGTKRWIKILGIAIAVLVLLVVVMMLIGGGGGHGPGRHESSGDPAPEHTPPAGSHGMLQVNG